MTGFVFLGGLTLMRVAADISEHSGVSAACFRHSKGLDRSVQRLQHGAMMNNSRRKSGAQGSLDNGGQAR